MITCNPKPGSRVILVILNYKPFETNKPTEGCKDWDSGKNYSNFHPYPAQNQAQAISKIWKVFLALFTAGKWEIKSCGSGRLICIDLICTNEG